jgi:glycosyltransferase involved in cell wall biosynthesis
LVKKESAVVCISHMDGANWVNVMSRSAAKKCLIVHGTILHDRAMNKSVQFLRKNVLIPLLYNKAEVTVAVSEGIRHELTLFCNVKNAINIPHYFDLNEIESKANEVLSTGEEMLMRDYRFLVTAGRFHEQKKQNELFPIFRELKKRYQDIRLMILGDGELKDQYIREIKEQGLTLYEYGGSQPLDENYDVYLMGYKENPFKYIKRSYLFLFPSAWEGFPMALCETMVLGVPVLASDCPTGPREILAPGSFDPKYNLKNAERSEYGILLPMFDKDSFQAEWIHSIESLLIDKELRDKLGKNARIRMNDYGKDVIMKKWKELMKNLHP